MRLSPTIAAVALLVVSGRAFAAPAENSTTVGPAPDDVVEKPDRPDVQTPEAIETKPQSEGTVATQTEETAADESEPAPEQPIEPAPDASGDADLSGLLDAPEEPDTPRRPAPPPAEDGDRGISKDERLARYYKNQYRPEDNPGNLHLGGRLVFASLGGNEDALSGRMGGANIDIGHQFNWIGYGLSLAAYGGQGFTGPEGATEVNGLFGGGPSITLGRLALLRQGFMHVDVGYDFLYGPARATAFAAQEDPTFAPDPIAPHGPRLRLDLGLLLFQTLERRTRQGVGLTLGYQGLVGDLMGGDLPYTNVLTLGLSYWAG